MENKNQSGFRYYQRVQDDSVPYHIKQIKLEEIDLSRPTVIEFTGSGATDLSWVNGYLKNTESQLMAFRDQIKVEDVNIIGVDYNSHPEIYGGQSVKTAVEYSKDFVDDFLVPLSLDENGNLNVQKACKNLRKITLKTHCMGHEVSYNINEYYKSRLLKLGYSKEEAKQIMSQILEIVYGSEYAPLDFKQVHINSLNDFEVKDNLYPLDAFLSLIDKIDISKEDREEIEKLHSGKIRGKITEDFFKENERIYVFDNEENSLVFCFSYPVDIYEDDHSLHFARLGKNGEKAKRATNVGYYVALGMACVLCNSVSNSMQNLKTEKLIPLELEELRQNASKVVEPLNSQPLGKRSEWGED